MRLPRTGEPGSERPRALVDGDLLVDLSDVVFDYDDDFFAAGSGPRPSESWPVRG